MNNWNEDSRRTVSSLDGRRIKEEGEVKVYRTAIPLSFKPFEPFKLLKLTVAVLLCLFVCSAAADTEYPKPEWWDTINPEVVPVKDGDSVSYHETRKALLRRSRGFIHTWHLIGPFPEEGKGGFRGAVYPPEKGINLQGAYPGKDGKQLTWKKIDSKDDRIDLRKYGEDSFVYAYTEIQAPEARRTKAWFAARDGLAVWINGAKQFEQERRLGDDADQYSVPVSLVKGTNRILLKICNTGAHSYFWFYFRISDYSYRAATVKSYSALLDYFKDLDQDQVRENHREITYNLATLKETHLALRHYRAFSAVTPSIKDRTSLLSNVGSGLKPYHGSRFTAHTTAMQELLKEYEENPAAMQEAGDSYLSLLRLMATRLRDNADYSGAAYYFWKLVRENPKSGSARHVEDQMELAWIYGRCGRWARAMQDARKVEKLIKKDDRHFNRSRELFKVLKQSAARGLRSNAGINENVAVLRYLRVAERYAEEKKYDQAVRQFQTTIEKFSEALYRSKGPHFTSMHYHCVQSLHALGEEGQKAYRAAFDEKAGRLFAKAQDEHDKAGLERVTRLYPLASYADDALLALANLFMEEGDLTRASARFGALLRDYPDSGLARLPILAKQAFCLRGIGDQTGMNAVLDTIEDKYAKQELKVAGRSVSGTAYAAGLRQAVGKSIPRPDALKLAAALTETKPQWELRLPSSPLNAEIRETVPGNPVAPLAYAGQVYKGRIYFQDGREILCLNQKDGRILWRRRAPVIAGPWPGKSAAYDYRYLEGLKVFPVAVYNDRIYARLSFEGDERVRPPVQAGICCMDAESGELLWVRGSLDDRGMVQVHSDPYIRYGMVFITARRSTTTILADHVLAALDAGTGRLLWQLPISGGIPETMHGSWKVNLLGAGRAMTAENGILFTATGFGSLAAVDVFTGKLLWAREHPRANVYDWARDEALSNRLSPGRLTPVISDDTVYFAPPDGTGLLAVNKFSGELEGERPLLRPQYLIGEQDDILYLATTAKIMAVRTDNGATQWEWSLPTRSGWSEALLTARHVLVPGREGLYVLDAFTGKAVEQVFWKDQQLAAGNLIYTGDGVIGFTDQGLVYHSLGRSGSHALTDLTPKPKASGTVEPISAEEAFTFPLIAAQEIHGQQTVFEVSPEGRLFALRGSRLFAPDLSKEGNVFWQTDVPPGWDGKMFRADDHMIVIGYKRRIIAYDAADGKKLWEQPCKDYIKILLGLKTVVVQDREYQSFIYGADTGRRLRSIRVHYYETKGGPWFEDGNIIWATLYNQRNGKREDDTVHIYSLNEEALIKGDYSPVTEIKAIKIATKSYQRDCVHKRGPMIYLLEGGGDDRNIIAMNLKTGQQLWKSPVHYKNSRWEIRDDYILVSSTHYSNPHHYILDIKDGKILRHEERKVHGEKSNLILPDAGESGVMYNIHHGSEIKVYAIKRGDDKPLWETVISDNSRWAKGLFQAGPYLVIPMQSERKQRYDSRLAVLDRETGEVAAMQSLPGLTIRKSLLVGSHLLLQSDESLYFMAPGDHAEEIAALQPAVDSGRATPQEFHRYRRFTAAHIPQVSYCEPAADAARAEADPENDIRLNTHRDYEVLIPGTSWTGPEDLNAHIRLNWNKQGILIKITVEDDRHVNPFQGRSLVLGDSVLVTIDGRRHSWELYRNQHEFVFAQTEGQARACRLYGPAPGDEPACITSRTPDQKGLVYDVLIPWVAIGSWSNHPKETKRMGLTISIIDHDGQGAEGRLVWGGGVFDERQTTRFGQVVFLELNSESIGRYKKAIAAAPDWPGSWNLFMRILHNNTSPAGARKGADYARWFIKANPRSVRVPDAMGMLWMYEKRLSGKDSEKEVIAFAQKAGAMQSAIETFKKTFITLDYYLDPEDPCETLMLSMHFQRYHGWDHRVILGNYWPFGDVRYRLYTRGLQPVGVMGIPGQWNQLRVPAGALDAMHQEISEISIGRQKGRAYLDNLNLGGVFQVDEQVPPGHKVKGFWDWVNTPVKTGSKSWLTANEKKRTYQNIQFEKPVMIGLPVASKITAENIERVRAFMFAVPESREAYNAAAGMMEFLPREKRAAEITAFVSRYPHLNNSANFLNLAKDYGALKIEEIQPLMRRYRMPAEVVRTFYNRFEKVQRDFAFLGVLREDDRLPGEEELFTDQTINLKETYKDKNGDDVGWMRPFAEKPEGYMSFRDLNKMQKEWKDGDIVYAYAKIESPNLRKVLLNNGVGYVTVSAWLNGKKVIDGLFDREHQKDEYGHAVELRKGENTLLFKLRVTQYRNWYFSMRISALNGKKLPDLKFSSIKLPRKEVKKKD